MGQRSATVVRPAGHGRRLAAVALAILGTLTLGAGLLVGLSEGGADGTPLRPSTSSAARPVGALAARFAGSLPALPTGPVQVALAAFSLPVGALLVLPAGPGLVILGVEVGAVSARVGGSMVLLGAPSETVAPPFQDAAGETQDRRGQGPPIASVRET